MDWSAQQEEIFRWFEEPRGNLVVNALAGTGKTTTIIEGVNRAHPRLRSIVCCAFNVDIAKVLKAKLTNPRAKAMTLHALGFGAVRNYWSNVAVEGDDQRGQRAEGLTERACGATVPDVVKRLVTKLHTKGREMHPLAQRPRDLEDIAYQFDCEPDPMWHRSGYDVDYVCAKALVAMQLAADVKPAFIDFADMIFLPVRNGWLVPQYDAVIVDEMQDMTAAQLLIARGVCRGHFCGVGDRNQAIYGFRGADSNSIDRLKKELDATELGLTVTYRCGFDIVEEAQRLVPAFEAGEHNPPGLVRLVPEGQLVDQAQLGDFVLSRKNAPLVAVAMSLLRAQKRARVKGKDIGKGLLAVVRKLTKNRPTLTVEGFLELVREWEQREVSRFLAADRPGQAELVHDKAGTLVELTDGIVEVAELERRIDFLFQDNGLGDAGVITCSSVHRAKGLEANRVFVLRETLYPRGDSPEERNIEYVAITRAKQELVWVSSFVPPIIDEVPDHHEQVLDTLDHESFR
jgi:superfamily I DNA/RNA helicase